MKSFINFKEMKEKLSKNFGNLHIYYLLSYYNVPCTLTRAGDTTLA